MKWRAPQAIRGLDILLVWSIPMATGSGLVMLLVWSIINLDIISRGMLLVRCIPMAMMTAPGIGVGATDLAAIAGPETCMQRLFMVV